MQVRNSRIMYFNLLLVFILLALTKCNKKAIIEISNNDIKVRCLFNTAEEKQTDVVLVRKNGKVKEIYKASNTLTDIAIKDKTIIIKLYNPSNGVVYTKPPSKVFDYTIIIDSSATDADYKNRAGIALDNY